jgi:hypothetical protein
MQPFVLYSLSGLAIAVFFVATIFNDKPENAKVRWVRYRSPAAPDEFMNARQRDPVEMAVNVTQPDGESR